MANGKGVKPIAGSYPWSHVFEIWTLQGKNMSILLLMILVSNIRSYKPSTIKRAYRQPPTPFQQARIAA